MSSDLRKPSALVSLTNTYSDSESDNESDDNSLDNINGHQFDDQNNDLSANLTESRTNSPSNALKSIESLDKRKECLSDRIEESFDANEAEVRPNSPISYHKTLSGKSEDQIMIPLEPSETSSKSLQEKILRLHEKMKRGYDMNTIIQKRKDFRNPSIYEKLIAYCGIDEMATNYPPDVYDPHIWTEKSFYEELAKRQKEDMDRRERERKERVKVEFISGTKKFQNTDSNESTKKKSKWDNAPTQTSQINLIIPQVVRPVTVATGTKPIVISASGTISKKSK